MDPDCEVIHVDSDHGESDDDDTAEVSTSGDNLFGAPSQVFIVRGLSKAMTGFRPSVMCEGFLAELSKSFSGYILAPLGRDQQLSFKYEPPSPKFSRKRPNCVSYRLQLLHGSQFLYSLRGLPKSLRCQRSAHALEWGPVHMVFAAAADLDTFLSTLKYVEVEEMAPGGGAGGGVEGAASGAGAQQQHHELNPVTASTTATTTTAGTVPDWVTRHKPEQTLPSALTADATSTTSTNINTTASAATATSMVGEEVQVLEGTRLGGGAATAAAAAAATGMRDGDRESSLGGMQWAVAAARLLSVTEGAEASDAAAAAGALDALPAMPEGLPLNGGSTADGTDTVAAGGGGGGRRLGGFFRWASWSRWWASSTTTTAAAAGAVVAATVAATVAAVLIKETRGKWARGGVGGGGRRAGGGGKGI